MKVESPFADFPPNWDIFEAHLMFVGGAKGFGFATGGGDLNRFAARYRIAKRFRHVEFENVASDTSDGYSALTHLLLVYSAFEHLLRCIGVELRHTLNLLDEAERMRAIAGLRKLNGSTEFFEVLRQHLDPNYRRQADSFLAEAPCNIIYLAAGIRHSFAHGKLAASPSGCPPQSVATCSRFLIRVLFRIMDREFGNRMAEFYESMYPSTYDK